jgi:hypothetical protein
MSRSRSNAPIVRVFGCSPATIAATMSGARKASRIRRPTSVRSRPTARASARSVGNSPDLIRSYQAFRANAHVVVRIHACTCVEDAAIKDVLSRKL